VREPTKRAQTVLDNHDYDIFSLGQRCPVVIGSTTENIGPAVQPYIEGIFVICVRTVISRKTILLYNFPRANQVDW
jgi:hypothetical protein